MVFFAESTIRFCIDRGLGESYYILCPVCSNHGIILTRWEDGSEEATECSTCRRRDEMMEGEEA